jgi:hypothetical protein
MLLFGYNKFYFPSCVTLSLLPIVLEHFVIGCRMVYIIGNCSLGAIES